MKVTKYEHACFTVEKDGKLLIVDPGSFTKTLGTPENVVAIVVTHEHGDHFDPNALGALIAHNPEAIIIADDAITTRLGDTLPTKTVAAGDIVTVEPFTLEFFGGEHAIIHKAIPMVANLGVMINETVYYPGDSLVEPARPVELLAVPVSAPWMRLSEAIDFMLHIAPQKAFPTHDAFNSPAGEAITTKLISGFSEPNHIEYLPLIPGQSVEL